MPLPSFLPIIILLYAIKKDISYLLRKTLLDKDKNGNEYDSGCYDGIHSSIAAVDNSKDFREALLNVYKLRVIDRALDYDKGWNNSVEEAVSIIEISVGLSIDEVLDMIEEKEVAPEMPAEQDEIESIAIKGVKI